MDPESLKASTVRAESVNPSTRLVTQLVFRPRGVGTWGDGPRLHAADVGDGFRPQIGRPAVTSGRTTLAGRRVSGRRRRTKTGVLTDLLWPAGGSNRGEGS